MNPFARWNCTDATQIHSCWRIEVEGLPCADAFSIDDAAAE
jgi:hypothetical protein